MEKIELGPGGCWLWTAHIDQNGYGTFSIKKTPRKAHRVDYEAFVGPVSDGLQLDHLCRVRHCVNPEHLEPVTAAENNARSLSISARNMAKTHCSNGHPFDSENTYVMPDGGRGCRRCRKDADRAYRERRRAARADRVPAHFKLSLEAARDIRRRVARGERPSALAREYGVVKSTVSAVLSGRNWKEPAGVGDLIVQRVNGGEG